MTMRLRLDEAQRDDLRAIRDLPLEKLQAAVERLRKLEPIPVRPDKLLLLLSENLPEHEDAIECLVRQVLFFFDWSQGEQELIADLLRGIRESLRTDSGWSAPQLEQWQQVEVAFGELLGLKIVRLMARAIELSYEYTNVLRGTRILTDIRPIFNDKADAIDGAVVSHTLLVRFASSEGPHELTVAMNQEDVTNLAEQCDRALRKGQTARGVMQNAKVPTIVSGEDADA